LPHFRNAQLLLGSLAGSAFTSCHVSSSQLSKCRAEDFQAQADPGGVLVGQRVFWSQQKLCGLKHVSHAIEPAMVDRAMRRSAAALPGFAASLLHVSPLWAAAAIAGHCARSCTAMQRTPMHMQIEAVPGSPKMDAMIAIAKQVMRCLIMQSSRAMGLGFDFRGLARC
jgi:hypothetical protein